MPAKPCALLTQPGGFQLLVGAGPQATAQHYTHPALPAVQLCPEAHTVMPKTVSMSTASLQPLHHPVFILRIPCLPFHSLLLHCLSFISFKEKLYNLKLSNVA